MKAFIFASLLALLCGPAAATTVTQTLSAVPNPAKTGETVTINWNIQISGLPVFDSATTGIATLSFGDGTKTSIGFDPATGGAGSVDHVYGTAGTFDIALAGTLSYWTVEEVPIDNGPFAGDSLEFDYLVTVVETINIDTTTSVRVEDPTPVPLPASALLLLTALGGLAARRRLQGV